MYGKLSLDTAQMLTRKFKAAYAKNNMEMLENLVNKDESSLKLFVKK